MAVMKSLLECTAIWIFEVLLAHIAEHKLKIQDATQLNEQLVMVVISNLQVLEENSTTAHVRPRGISGLIELCLVLDLHGLLAVQYDFMTGTDRSKRKTSMGIAIEKREKEQ